MSDKKPITQVKKASRSAIIPPHPPCSSSWFQLYKPPVSVLPNLPTTTYPNSSPASRAVRDTGEGGGGQPVAYQPPCRPGTSSKWRLCLLPFGDRSSGGPGGGFDIASPISPPSLLQTPPLSASFRRGRLGGGQPVAYQPPRHPGHPSQSTAASQPPRVGSAVPDPVQLLFFMRTTRKPRLYSPLTPYPFSTPSSPHPVILSSLHPFILSSPHTPRSKISKNVVTTCGSKCLPDSARINSRTFSADQPGR